MAIASLPGVRVEVIFDERDDFRSEHNVDFWKQVEKMEVALDASQAGGWWRLGALSTRGRRVIVQGLAAMADPSQPSIRRQQAPCKHRETSLRDKLPVDVAD